MFTLSTYVTNGMWYPMPPGEPGSWVVREGFLEEVS